MSKEVQREVTAGISGVARVMERLDTASKRTERSSGHVTSDAVGTSDLLRSRKVMQNNLTAQSFNGNVGTILDSNSSNAPVLVSSTLSSTLGQMKVTRVQVCNYCSLLDLLSQNIILFSNFFMLMALLYFVDKYSF